MANQVQKHRVSCLKSSRWSSHPKKHCRMTRTLGYRASKGSLERCHLARLQQQLAQGHRQVSRQYSCANGEGRQAARKQGGNTGTSCWAEYSGWITFSKPSAAAKSHDASRVNLEQRGRGFWVKDKHGLQARNDTCTQLQKRHHQGPLGAHHCHQHCLQQPRTEQACQESGNETREAGASGRRTEGPSSSDSGTSTEVSRLGDSPRLCILLHRWVLLS